MIEMDSIVLSRGGAVAASRCSAVAAARSEGDLGEKEKIREKKREPRGRERWEWEPRAHRDDEILCCRPKFHIPQKYCGTTKIVVSNTKFLMWLPNTIL
jgi:hypothetical protein